MGSKLSTGSIRFFLFADVFADLLQLEPHRGHGVATGPEMLSREVSLLTAQSGYGDGTLRLEKPDHRGHRVLGRIVSTYARGPASSAPQKLLLFLLGPSVEDFSPLPTRLSIQHLASSLGNEHHWYWQSHLEGDRL